MVVRFSFLVESPHHSMANRIDNVHRKRTLLKIVKGCGTHLLGSQAGNQEEAKAAPPVRLKTKAGQAQMAKQGAPSASKLAAKRVATKRRR